MDFHYSHRQTVALAALGLFAVFYLDAWRPELDSRAAFLAFFSALVGIPVLIGYLSARNLQKKFLLHPSWPAEFMKGFDGENSFPTEMVLFLGRKKRDKSAKAMSALEKAWLGMARRSILFLILAAVFAGGLAILQIFLVG